MSNVNSVLYNTYSSSNLTMEIPWEARIARDPKFEAKSQTQGILPIARVIRDYFTAEGVKAGHQALAQSGKEKLSGLWSSLQGSSASSQEVSFILDPPSPIRRYLTRKYELWSRCYRLRSSSTPPSSIRRGFDSFLSTLNRHLFDAPLELTHHRKSRRIYVYPTSGPI